MAAKPKTETRGFETEAKQLLHLMIHSLYSNKEIFLRELISNASDAVDKLRFETLSNPELLAEDAELKVQIDFDEKKRTITIADNGIGMIRDEVIDNLGTIAKSGTVQFLESLTGDQQKDSQLIGRFGVGFYSAFIVADEVEVLTRKVGTDKDQATLWKSKGEAEYSIVKANKAERGTTVTLHLKKEEKEFAESFRLRNIVKKYAKRIFIVDSGLGTARILRGTRIPVG
jgi:molecular chaperone HtpG